VGWVDDALVQVPGVATANHLPTPDSRSGGQPANMLPGADLGGMQAGVAGVSRSGSRRRRDDEAANAIAKRKLRGGLARQRESAALVGHVRHLHAGIVPRGGIGTCPVDRPCNIEEHVKGTELIPRSGTISGAEKCRAAAERRPEAGEVKGDNGRFLVTSCFYGADARIRTADLLITNQRNFL
jgi:hypothetical protein